jgi:hypothetical protein
MMAGIVLWGDFCPDYLIVMVEPLVDWVDRASHLENKAMIVLEWMGAL